MLRKFMKATLILGIIYPFLIVIPTMIFAFLGYDPVTYLIIIGLSTSSTLVYHSIRIRKRMKDY